MTNIITEIEQTAVKDWNAFLAGLQWVGKEFTIAVSELEKLDPGLQQQVQLLLAAGDAAAQTAAGVATGGMTNIIGDIFDTGEQLLAEAFQKATGNNPAAQRLSAASVATLQQLSTAAQAAVPVTIAKLVTIAANALSAGAAQATPSPPPAVPTS